MKAQLILTILALTPALLAAEPNSSLAPGAAARVSAAPSPTAPVPAPSIQEDVADQAALVQQIGEEAAKGFDPEVHAHLLRAQIEALVVAPAIPKAAVQAPVAASPTASNKSSGTSSAAQQPKRRTQAPGQETGIRQTIQKLRSTLDELEAQLEGTRTSQ